MMVIWAVELKRYAERGRHALPDPEIDELRLLAVKWILCSSLSRWHVRVASPPRNRV